MKPDEIGLTLIVSQPDLEVYNPGFVFTCFGKVMAE